MLQGSAIQLKIPQVSKLISENAAARTRPSFNRYLAGLFGLLHGIAAKEHPDFEITRVFGSKFQTQSGLRLLLNMSSEIVEDGLPALPLLLGGVHLFRVEFDPDNHAICSGFEIDCRVPISE